METNEISKNAKGGTELMMEGLYRHLPHDLLDYFQIIPSRVRELKQDKIRIYWLHDLPGDPESEHLKSGGWNKFDKLVFVSNWQMQAYQKHYGLPWYKCIVLHNAIEPIPTFPAYEYEKPTDVIRFIYHTTPHRGLNILVAAFDKLCKVMPNVKLKLDVFSSFKIYGWEQRDEAFKDLFDFCRNHPNINYHGTQPNEVVRAALQEAHIFAYPSVWQETSCISLMEAMSAGLVCIHPNYGALYETGGEWTWMYQYQENQRDHIAMLYGLMSACVSSYNIGVYKGNMLHEMLKAQKLYTDMFYSWENRKAQWYVLLTELLKEHRRIDFNVASSHSKAT